MPINDPVRGQKIAPASLAFERSRRRGQTAVIVENGDNVTTYQDDVQTNSVDDVTPLILKDVSNLDKAVARAGLQGEQRAKAWTAEYERALDWCIDDDITITTKAFYPVPFQREVVRSMGAAYIPGATQDLDTWHYICPADAVGVYHVSAMLQMRLTSGVGCTVARLGVIVDGSLYRVIDAIDNGYAGENPILDVKLCGSSLVPLRSGQKMQIGYFVNSSGAPGTLQLLAPTSVYGYVSAHRTRCELGGFDGKQNGGRITSPISGVGYAFDV
jgi:hypothetical protein